MGKRHPRGRTGNTKVHCKGGVKDKIAENVNGSHITVLCGGWDFYTSRRV